MTEVPAELNDKQLMNLLGRVLVRETYARKVRNPFAEAQHREHKGSILKEMVSRGLAECG